MANGKSRRVAWEELGAVSAQAEPDLWGRPNLDKPVARFRRLVAAAAGDLCKAVNALRPSDAPKVEGLPLKHEDNCGCQWQPDEWTVFVSVCRDHVEFCWASSDGRFWTQDLPGGRRYFADADSGSMDWPAEDQAAGESAAKARAGRRLASAARRFARAVNAIRPAGAPQVEGPPTADRDFDHGFGWLVDGWEIVPNIDSEGIGVSYCTHASPIYEVTTEGECLVIHAP